MENKFNRELEKDLEILNKSPDFKPDLNLFNDNEKWTEINEEFLNSFVEMLK